MYSISAWINNHISINIVSPLLSQYFTYSRPRYVLQTYTWPNYFHVLFHNPSVPITVNAEVHLHITNFAPCSHGAVASRNIKTDRDNEHNSTSTPARVSLINYSSQSWVIEATPTTPSFITDDEKSYYTKPARCTRARASEHIYNIHIVYMDTYTYIQRVYIGMSYARTLRLHNCQGLMELQVSPESWERTAASAHQATGTLPSAFGGTRGYISRLKER